MKDILLITIRDVRVTRLPFGKKSQVKVIYYDVVTALLLVYRLNNSYS